MRPSAEVQIGWGVAAALGALALIALLAFVPDPFLQQRVWTTRFDDVEALTPGAPVYFAGARVGSIRSLKLDPETRTFLVRLGVSRAWTPSPCAFAQVVESNPLTTPRTELSAPVGTAARCAAVQAAARCTPVAVSGGGPRALTGCARRNDLFQQAEAALAQITAVAGSAARVAAKLEALAPSGPGGAGGFDLAKIGDEATATLSSVEALTRRLEETMAPGRGDVALTLANARRASGELDVKRINTTVDALNASIASLNAVVAENRAGVRGALGSGQALTEDARALLETLSTQLTTTSGNLDRASANLSQLAERLSGDPTFAIRGRRYADPPSPGGAR